MLTLRFVLQSNWRQFWWKLKRKFAAVWGCFACELKATFFCFWFDRPNSDDCSILLRFVYLFVCLLILCVFCFCCFFTLKQTKAANEKLAQKVFSTQMRAAFSNLAAVNSFLIQSRFNLVSFVFAKNTFPLFFCSLQLWKTFRFAVYFAVSFSVSFLALFCILASRVQAQLRLPSISRRCVMCAWQKLTCLNFVIL